MIRVLVVDDSWTARSWISQMIAKAPDLEIAAEAANGSEAVDIARKIKPDVIVMDMAMPLLDGVSATHSIMTKHPTPIIILSAAENRESYHDVMEAIRFGAIEVIDKPTRETNRGSWELYFLTMLRAAPHMRLDPPEETPKKLPPDNSTTGAEVPKLIGIGASTGGPRAVAEIVKDIETNDAVIAIIVHFPEGMNSHYIEWLASIARVPVCEITDGLPLSTVRGQICVARAGKHVSVKHGRFRLDSGKPRHFFRPSIDVFFESIAKEIGANAVGILLTGMGEDGAEGLKLISESGGDTIAQDEESCVVFGMPKAAIERSAARQVLPLTDIARELHRLCNQKKVESR